jgi:vancomycin permeability regulator SanA
MISPSGTFSTVSRISPQGVVLGKPKGTIQSSMYDKDKEKIRELLALGVPQKRIVESHLGYGTTKSLSYYIRTRKLYPKTAR